MGIWREQHHSGRCFVVVLYLYENAVAHATNPSWTIAPARGTPRCPPQSSALPPSLAALVSGRLWRPSTFNVVPSAASTVPSSKACPNCPPYMRDRDCSRIRCVAASHAGVLSLLCKKGEALAASVNLSSSSRTASWVNRISRPRFTLGLEETALFKSCLTNGLAANDDGSKLKTLATSERSVPLGWQNRLSADEAGGGEFRSPYRNSSAAARPA